MDCIIRLSRGLLHDHSKYYGGAHHVLLMLPRWTYGASRVQVDADIKLLNEFLESLQSDVVRGSTTVTSFESGRPHNSKGAGLGRVTSYYSDSLVLTNLLGYLTHLKSINSLLRLLVENEIYRLMVWGNPSNDLKRGVDHINGVERGMNEVYLVCI
jgi:phosphatidylinositol 4-kinase A